MSDDLLGRWREAGQWESEGSFTLDAGKALEKLRAFALDEPRRYILGLVSWAVASSASAIDIEARSGCLEAVVHGVSLEHRQLLELFAESGMSGVASRELAVACISASGLPRARVTLSGQDARLRMNAQGVSIEALTGSVTSWRLEEPRSVLGWVGRVLGDERLEIPLLRECCAHCEVPITVNGATIYRPVQLPRIRKAIHLSGPPLPIEPETLTAATVETRPSPGEFSAIVAASTTPILRTNSLYVVRGVSYEMAPAEHDGVNFTAVVNAPHLLKDLSGRGLVANDERQRIGSELRRLCQELAEFD